MTSTVKVIAHPAANKKVVVNVYDGDELIETVDLKHGEQLDRTFYDGKKVETFEQDI